MKFSEKELERRIDLLHQYVGDMRFLKAGTPVCCDLFGFWEHSGIYLGNGKIAHLTGDGDIEAVYPEEFVARIGNETDEPMKYVCSPKDQKALASYAAYCFARSKIGKTQDYKLLRDNCHRFTARCLSLNDDIETCFFAEPENCLEKIIEKEFGDELMTIKHLELHESSGLIYMPYEVMKKIVTEFFDGTATYEVQLSEDEAKKI